VPSESAMEQAFNLSMPLFAIEETVIKQERTLEEK
jgi:hypothetical protein